MTVKLNKGSQPARVYNVLLPHEYMSLLKISEKSGVHVNSLSGSLTKLRRAGLAKHNNGSRGQKMWKKFPQNALMYPPQPDSRKTKKTKKTKIKELPRIDTIDEIMDRIMTDFVLLRDSVKQNTENCAIATEQLAVIKQALGHD